jgi:phosphotransferase system enzyme I (PtsI)
LKVWNGKPISPGYAEGTALVYRSRRGAAAAPRRIATDEVGREIERFRTAAQRAADDLGALRRRLSEELGEAGARIFDVHIALLQDASFRSRVEQEVAEHLVNAEQALEAAVGEIAGRIAAIGDEYLAERADDVRDLGRRVLAHFSDGGGLPRLELPDDCILVADELLPSDTVRLDRTRLKAIVTERCGRTSHAAILAKARGIPAVSDLVGLCDHVAAGARMLVDGVTGAVIVRPSAARAAHFAQDRSTYERALSSALREERQACISRDGTRIELYANLGRVSEAPDVLAHGLSGVGLFRTEVLFLEHESPPTFETHCDAYRQVAEALAGLPLVIRTLDLGGDKHPAFLPPPAEHNPMLGLRGLRFALHEQSLLRTQLAAILAVARDHPVRVMFPMVLGGGDLAAAIGVLEAVARERGDAPLPPVGAMIETPSAIFALDDIARRADFLSIGTNDLTQFLLVADRDSVELIDDYSVLHPSVLRAIRSVVTTAGQADKPLSVCGEAAGDPVLAPVLAGLGVRQLSMSPARAAAVGHVLRATDLSEAAAIAEAMLACDSLESVRSRLALAPWMAEVTSGAAATGSGRAV